MDTLNNNTAGSILDFLTPKDASRLARTSKFFRDVVEQNQCQVLSSGVWYWNIVEQDVSVGVFRWSGYAKRKQWEDSKRTTTKAMAMQELERLKKNENGRVRTVTIYHYEAPIGCVANRALWKIEWEIT